MGADRVIFGSDWPHIEGMPEPLDYLRDVAHFDAATQAQDPARQQRRAEHAAPGLIAAAMADPILVAKNGDVECHLLPALANRHGLDHGRHRHRQDDHAPDDRRESLEAGRARCSWPT